MQRKFHTYPDGSKYEGQWQDEKRHGQGVWIKPDGTKYAGEWKEDKPDGHGVLTYPDGLKRVGEWEKGEFLGETIPYAGASKMVVASVEAEEREEVGAGSYGRLNLREGGQKRSDRRKKSRRLRNKVEKEETVTGGVRGDQNRPEREKKERPGKRRLIPVGLVLLFLLLLVFLVYSFSGGGDASNPLSGLLERLPFYNRDVVVTLPAALLTGADLEEIVATAREKEGIKEAIINLDGSLTYVLSVEARDSLAEEAQANVSAKTDQLKTDLRYLAILEVGHNDLYNEFLLHVDEDLDQYGYIGPGAMELFLAAVRYRLFAESGSAEIEVTVTIEDSAHGAVVDTMVYPEALGRAPEIFEKREEDEVAVGPGPGDRVIVDTGPDNLNLRDGPGIVYLIIDILASGTVLEVVDVEGEWLEVITPGQKQGWVHGGYVRLEE